MDKQKYLHRRMDLVGMPWQFCISYSDVQVFGAQWDYFALAPDWIPDWYIPYWAKFHEGRAAYLIAKIAKK